MCEKDTHAYSKTQGEDGCLCVCVFRGRLLCHSSLMQYTYVPFRPVVATVATVAKRIREREEKEEQSDGLPSLPGGR